MKICLLIIIKDFCRFIYTYIEHIYELNEVKLISQKLHVYFTIYENLVHVADLNLSNISCVRHNFFNNKKFACPQYT